MGCETGQTGDSWSSGVARPIIFGFDDASLEYSADPKAMAFFVIYTVLSDLFLLNVVVAVMIDKFTQCVGDEAHTHEAEEAARKWAAADYHSMDPLLRSLAAIDTRTQLDKTIHNLFKILSQDGKTLSFLQLHAGIKHLPFTPRIYFTIDDWDSMTGNGEHTDDDDALSAQPFVDILQHLTRQYLRKRLTTELQRHRNAGDTEIHLLSLKLLADQVDVVNFGAIGTHSPHTNIYAAVAAVDNYPAERVEVRENKMASASPRQISIDVEIQTPALPASLLGPDLLAQAGPNHLNVVTGVEKGVNRRATPTPNNMTASMMRNDAPPASQASRMLVLPAEPQLLSAAAKTPNGREREFKF